MAIIEMDPKDVLAAIEGYTNELDAEQRSLESFYRQFKCKRCGGPVQKEFSKTHAYADPGVMNARALLRCTMCRCLFDPHSGLVVELGDTTRTPSGIPLIGGEK